MEINGVTFEISKKALSIDTRNRFATIYNCYDRCSKLKKNIWLSWRKFFVNLTNPDGVCMLNGVYFVNSFNTFQFTIGAICRLYDKILYFLITPTHNYVYEFEFQAVDTDAFYFIDKN